MIYSLHALKIVSVRYLWVVFRQFTCTKLIPFGSLGCLSNHMYIKDTDIVIIGWLMIVMAAITFTSGFVTGLIELVPISNWSISSFSQVFYRMFCFYLIQRKKLPLETIEQMHNFHSEIVLLCFLIVWLVDRL